jgi:cysteine-rich repeat protein
LITPPGSGYSNDPTITISFDILATLANPFLNVQINFAANVIKVEGLGGFVLFLNPASVTTGISKGWKIGHLIVPFHINQTGLTFNMNSFASAYGPAYSPKCLLGFHKFSFKNQHTFSYALSINPNGNYIGLSETLNAANFMSGNLLCFGNSTECGEGYTHFDFITESCYISTTCPLPVFTGWNFTTLCPNCTQLVCDLCDPSDRSKCSLCKPNTNTRLSGTACICDTNYLPVTHPIDTASSGLWNNLTPSLLSCKLNCSAVIPGCLQNDCANASFCTVCLTTSNYVLLVHNATDQSCVLCNVQIVRCTTCVNSSHCSVCSDGSYLLSSVPTGSCPLCSSAMSHCTNCTDGSVCTLCELGYLVNPTTKKCDCNKTYNLVNCQSCTVAGQCDFCVALHFLNSTTLKCQPCSDIHPSCTDCSDENTCTSCSAGFALDSVAKSGSVTCRECGKFINNCTLCSSSSLCTDCDFFYGLEGPSCKICNQLLMPGCESCETSALCLTCDSQTRMIDHICHYCDEVINCADCIVHTNILWCTVCVPGFTVTFSSFNGVPFCKSCQHVTSYCKDCTSMTQCTSCLSPYLIGFTGLCDKCETGYQFYFGYCIKQAGCISIYITPSGQDICLACASELHFVLDTKQQKCICAFGYKEFHQIGKFMECIPVCGDGILLPKDEDCDDKNTENEDGCNSYCKF